MKHMAVARSISSAMVNKLVKSNKIRETRVFSLLKNCEKSSKIHFRYLFIGVFER